MPWDVAAPRSAVTPLLEGGSGLVTALWCDVDTESISDPRVSYVSSSQPKPPNLRTRGRAERGAGGAGRRQLRSSQTSARTGRGVRGLAPSTARSQLPRADSPFGFVTSCVFVRGFDDCWSRLAGLEEEPLLCRPGSFPLSAPRRDERTCPRLRWSHSQGKSPDGF